jgi:UDP-N-acetylmuramoylalanine-D-glutamate ligase
LTGTRPSESWLLDDKVPRRALVVGLARSGRAAAAALARRGVEVVAVDRSLDADAGGLARRASKSASVPRRSPCWRAWILS